MIFGSFFAKNFLLEIDILWVIHFQTQLIFFKTIPYYILMIKYLETGIYFGIYHETK